MILAGIDEAGYGPVLGPLVVGCAAFRIDAPLSETEPLPCLWKRLKRTVSRNRTKTGRKIHVNDSKIVYLGGLKELERSVLTLLAASGELPDGVEPLLRRLAPLVCEEMTRYPWYRPIDGEQFPFAQEPLPIRLMANALRAEMEQTNTACVHLAARVVCEHELNRMLAATRNKGSTLFSVAAQHLDHLLHHFAGEGLVIVCDRHGGRAHYGALLRLMFEDWSLEIISEQESCSEYRLLRDGQTVRLIFREKAEMASLSVAYASMVSKYLRETMMRRFNAYWQTLMPTLTPTAGYHTDGIRFLGDIAALRTEMGISDEHLIRSR